jgi:uncharacterized membrane protein
MFSRPRAREKQEYTFASHKYSPFPTHPTPTHNLFLSSSRPDWSKLHFTLIIRSVLLLLISLRSIPTSLATSLFFLLALSGSDNSATPQTFK